jgi:PBSX family phage terminase large subunit
MKVQFPTLESWQKDVHDAITDQLHSGKRFIVKSSRQKGKTFLLKVIVLEYALKYPNTINCIIEPVSSQCRRVFQEIVDAIETTPLYKSSNASDLIIRLKNGSEIIFKSAESKKSIRGTTATGICILDEAAYIDDEIIQIILPLINVHRAPLLVTSTPSFAEGWFYNQWMRQSDLIQQFDWSSSKYDFSKYISEDMIAEYKVEYTPAKFRTEILGEFISDSSFVFGNFKECIFIPTDYVPVYAGIDFGSGTGSDSTVVTFFNKYRQVIHIWSTNTLSPTEQIDTIANLINERPTLKKVLVEGNSIGEVYYDSIKSKLSNKMLIEKFMTTNDSKKEVIEDLILAFQRKEIGIMDDPMLIKQLSYYDIQRLKNGNYTYNNSNDSIHDDYVISLALGYHCFKLGDVNIGFGFKIKKKKKKEDR